MKHLFNKLAVISLLLCALIIGQSGCMRLQTGNTLYKNSVLACSYGTHYGYTDKLGENAISPVYDYAYSFNDFKIARVIQGGKYGLITTEGIYFLAPTYSYIGPFSAGGLAPFLEDDKVGYLATSGKVIIPATYSTEKGIFEFSDNGLCLFYQGGFYGIINEFNQTILDPKYEDINVTLWDLDVCGVCQNGLYAVYSSDGDPLTDFVYESLSYGGSSCLIAEKEGKFSYIDINGVTLFEQTFEEAGPFADNGLALVKVNGLYGYIDGTGAFAIEASFTDAHSFTEVGLAVAQASSGKYGYIDKTGAFKIRARYLSASDFVSDSTLSKSYAVIETDKGFGVINASGRRVVRPTYTKMTLAVYDDDYFVGYTDTETVIFKRSGKVYETFEKGGVNLEK